MGDANSIQETLGVKPEVYTALQKLRRALEISKADKKEQQLPNECEFYDLSRTKKQHTKPDTKPLSRIYTEDLKRPNRVTVHEQKESSETVGCSGFCIKSNSTQPRRNQPSERITTRTNKPSLSTTQSSVPTENHQRLLWDTDAMLKMEACLCFIETYGEGTTSVGLILTNS